MTKELKKAKALLYSSDTTLVYIKDGQTGMSRERGVAPLLALLDRGESLCDASAADKVVGKGAAFLYVLLGVREIYASVISTPAKELLIQHGISVFFDTETAHIRNRENTGFCPIESAVLGVSDPKEAEKIIRERVAKLRASKR